MNIKIRSAFAALLCYSSLTFATNDISFNPNLSLTLSGTYAELQRDPARPATGFAMNPNPSHEQGFNIGESELGISANIDPDFRGTTSFALGAKGTFSVENAFVQTNSLGEGIKLEFGRFFSGLGYLNEQHAHTWDFVDQPLAYATLWNNQLGEDGLQLKWLAPTDLFIELGGELGKGRGSPGTDTPKNGSGMGVLFAHIGDDIDTNHSWRVGTSLHQTQRVAAESKEVPDLHGNTVTNKFTGDSQTLGLDFVWKYSPNGNVHNSYVKLQGEYFRRHETGSLTYDTKTTNSTDSFATTQAGWYLQSIYQFMPRWRVGARYDQLDPGIAQIGVLNTGNVISDFAFKPTRTTLMLDYSPSEFSRLRMQVANDQSRRGSKDNQFFMQYIMSLGAHGAHNY